MNTLYSESERFGMHINVEKTMKITMTRYASMAQLLKMETALSMLAANSHGIMTAQVTCATDQSWHHGLTSNLHGEIKYLASTLRFSCY